MALKFNFQLKSNSDMKRLFYAFIFLLIGQFVMAQSVSVSTTPSSCGANGTVTLTVSGCSASGISYGIVGPVIGNSGLPYTQGPIVDGSTHTFDYLPAGAYSYTVNCGGSVLTGNFTVTGNYSTPLFTYTIANCNVTVNVVPGTGNPPFVYSYVPFSNGSPAGQQVNSAPTTATSYSIPLSLISNGITSLNLGVGDQCGNVNTMQATLPEFVALPTCNGNQISFQFLGGSAPYQFTANYTNNQGQLVALASLALSQPTYSITIPSDICELEIEVVDQCGKIYRKNDFGSCIRTNPLSLSGTCNTRTITFSGGYPPYFINVLNGGWIPVSGNSYVLPNQCATFSAKDSRCQVLTNQSLGLLNPNCQLTPIYETFRCFNSATGIITVGTGTVADNLRATGGSAPYRYEVYFNNTWNVISGSNQQVYTSSPGSRTYQFRIIDACGTVKNVVVYEPYYLLSGSTPYCGTSSGNSITATLQTNFGYSANTAFYNNISYQSSTASFTLSNVNGGFVPQTISGNNFGVTFYLPNNAPTCGYVVTVNQQSTCGSQFVSPQYCLSTLTPNLSVNQSCNQELNIVGTSTVPGTTINVYYNGTLFSQINGNAGVVDVSSIITNLAQGQCEAVLIEMITPGCVTVTKTANVCGAYSDLHITVDNCGNLLVQELQNEPISYVSLNFPGTFYPTQNLTLTMGGVNIKTVAYTTPMEIVYTDPNTGCTSVGTVSNLPFFQYTTQGSINAGNQCANADLYFNYSISSNGMEAYLDPSRSWGNPIYNNFIISYNFSNVNIMNLNNGLNYSGFSYSNFPLGYDMMNWTPGFNYLVLTDLGMCEQKYLTVPAPVLNPQVVYECNGGVSIDISDILCFSSNWRYALIEQLSGNTILGNFSGQTVTFAGLIDGTSYDVVLFDISTGNYVPTGQSFTYHFSPLSVVVYQGITCNTQTTGDVQISATSALDYQIRFMNPPAGYSGQTLINYTHNPSASINQTYQFSNLPQGTYRFIITDKCGNVRTVFGYVGPLNFTPTFQRECSALGDMIRIQAPVVLGTYSWTFNNPTPHVVSTDPNPLVPYEGPGVYTLNLTTANGCTYTTTMNIGVLQAANANAGQDISLCQSLAGTLNAQLPPANTSGQWTMVSGPNGGTVQFNNDQYALSTFTLSTYGTYVLRWSLCNSFDDVTVNAIAPITPTINVPLALCANASAITLAGTPSGGTFNIIPAVGSPILNATTFAGNTFSPGQYTIQYTGSLNGCPYTFSQVSEIMQPLSASYTTVGASCNASNGAINATISGGTSPYTYYVNGFVRSNLNNLAGGTYTVQIVDAIGCTNTQTVSIPSSCFSISGVTPTYPCADSCNISVTPVLNGGTAPFTYQWFAIMGGAQVAIPGTLSTNTVCCGRPFMVRVTDANGVSVTNIFTLPCPAFYYSVASGTVVDASCGNSNGSASVTVNPAVAPTGTYTYSWVSTAGGPVLSTASSAVNLAPGSYLVTVTSSALNCSKTTVVSVGTVTGPTISASSVNPVCSNGLGTATASATGGTTPYAFVWKDASNNTISTNSTASNLGAGTYTVQVTDGRGCIDVTTVTITPPAAIQYTLSVTDVRCFGQNTGSAVINPVGVSPFTFSTNGGTIYTSNNQLSNLAAGTYSVIVRDANGCMVTVPIVIQQPAAPIQISSTTNSPICFGGNNGSIQLNVTGGTAPYSYLWSPGVSTSNTANNLNGGMYYVVVTDNNGCSLRDSFMIDEKPNVIVSVATTNVTCFGQNNGSATVTVNSTNNVSYNWNFPGHTPIPLTQSSVNDFAAGSGSVQVTVDGCISPVRNFTITQPTPLTVISSVTQPTCIGNNGAISLNISGGTPFAGPFSYIVTWNQNLPNGTSQSGLSNGAYTYTVTDANGCTFTGFDTLITQNTLAVTAVTTTDNCDPTTNTGFAVLTVSPNLPGLVFTWNGPNGPTSCNTNSCNNLGSGTYVVTINNAAGTCPVNYPVTINNSNLTLDPNYLNVTNVSCHNGNDGAISITSSATGGTSPYRYDWYQTSQTGPLVASNTMSVSNLVADDYWVKVTDAYGCVTWQTVRVKEPAGFVINPVFIGNENCGRNGKVQFEVQGVALPVYFAFVPQGSTPRSYTQNLSVDIIQALPAGSYTLFVNDGGPCNETYNFTINAQPGVSVSLNPTNVTCNGICNGSIVSTVVGGTAPISYQWFPNVGTSPNVSRLCAGTYTLELVDSNGCKATATTAITQPTPIQPIINTVNTTCPNICDGSVVVVPQGGTAPYTINWIGYGNNATRNFGVNQFTQTALCAGSPAVKLTIIDAAGCQFPKDIVIGSGVCPTCDCGKVVLTKPTFKCTGLPVNGVFTWSVNGTQLTNNSGCSWSIFNITSSAGTLNFAGSGISFPYALTSGLNTLPIFTFSHTFSAGVSISIKLVSQSGDTCYKIIDVAAPGCLPCNCALSVDSFRIVCSPVTGQYNFMAYVTNPTSCTASMGWNNINQTSTINGNGTTLPVIAVAANSSVAISGVITNPNLTNGYNETFIFNFGGNAPACPGQTITLPYPTCAPPCYCDSTRGIGVSNPNLAPAVSRVACGGTVTRTGTQTLTFSPSGQCIGTGSSCANGGRYTVFLGNAIVANNVTYTGATFSYNFTQAGTYTVVSSVNCAGSSCPCSITVRILPTIPVQPNCCTGRSTTLGSQILASGGGTFTLSSNINAGPAQVRSVRYNVISSYISRNNCGGNGPIAVNMTSAGHRGAFGSTTATFSITGGVINNPTEVVWTAPNNGSVNLTTGTQNFNLIFKAPVVPCSQTQVLNVCVRISVQYFDLTTCDTFVCVNMRIAPFQVAKMYELNADSLDKVSPTFKKLTPVQKVSVSRIAGQLKYVTEVNKSANKYNRKVERLSKKYRNGKRVRASKVKKDIDRVKHYYEEIGKVALPADQFNAESLNYFIQMYLESLGIDPIRRTQR